MLGSHRLCAPVRAPLKVDAQPEGRVAAVDPELFAQVRKTIGITEQSFHASLGLQRGLQESNFAMVGSAGRSGAYFFLSPDQVP